MDNRKIKTSNANTEQKSQVGTSFFHLNAGTHFGALYSSCYNKIAAKIVQYPGWSSFHFSYIMCFLSSYLYFGNLTSCGPDASKNPKASIKQNETAGSLSESLLLEPEGVLALGEGVNSDTERS